MRHSFKAKLVLAACATLALTVAASMAASAWFFVRSLETALKDKLQSVAVAVSAFIDPEVHESLKRPEDMSRPEYLKLVTKLHHILVEDASIKFIYTLRPVPVAKGFAKKFTFVLDGGSARLPLDAESPDFSKIGDPYDKLPKEAREVLLTGMPAVDKNWATDQWGVTISGYAPLKDRRGRVIAILGVDMIARELDETMLNAKISLAIGICLAMLVGFAIAGTLSGRIMRPINDLHRATLRVANGDLRQPIAYNRRDELGTVLGTFNVMMQHIEHAQAMSVVQARMKSQLEIAATVQTQLFQWEKVTDERVRIGYFVRTAETMGGDWAHYHLSSGRFLYLLCSDVAGHGTAPAMVAAAVAGSFHGLKVALDSAAEPLGAAGVVEYFRPVVEAAGCGRFPMTIFVARVDLTTGLVEYSNAGHVPARVVRAPGNGRRAADREEKVIESLALPSNFLGGGLIDPLDKATTKTTRLGPGDMIVLFSDGLIERRDAEGRVFGARRLERAFKRSLESQPDKLCQEVVAKVTAYAGGDAPDDDITLLIAAFPKETCRHFKVKDEAA